MNKQIRSIGERFVLKITVIKRTDCSSFVEVSVSIGGYHVSSWTVSSWTRNRVRVRVRVRVAVQELTVQELSCNPIGDLYLLTKVSEKAKLQSVLNKTARYGFLPEWSPKTIDELLESSDITLFKAALKNPDHVIHPLLPPPKAPGYNLGKCSHGLLLPTRGGAPIGAGGS